MSMVSYILQGKDSKESQLFHYSKKRYYAAVSYTCISMPIESNMFLDKTELKDIHICFPELRLM